MELTNALVIVATSLKSPFATWCGRRGLVFWISLAIIDLMGTLIYGTQIKVVADWARPEEVHQLERGTPVLISTLKDVETGSRDYVLTANERYLAPYLAEKSDIISQLRGIDQSQEFDKSQRLRIGQLKQLSMSRITIADEPVASIRTSGSRVEHSDLTYLARAKAVMDKIRPTGDQTLAHEQRNSQNLRHILQQKVSTSNAIVALAVLVSLLSLVFLFFVRHRGLRRRIKSESDMRDLIADLENQVAARTAELGHSAAFMNLVLEHIPDTVCLMDVDDNYRYVLWNHVANHQEGPSSSDVIGTNAYSSLPPETSAWMRTEDERIMASRQPATTVIEELSTPIGSRTLEYRRVPTQDHDGRWRYLLGIVRDITEQRTLELQVRQIQRLDAIGHLTGGLAHDFNNLLAIIIGNSDLLREQIASGSVSVELADEVIAAAERGAVLTRRLLAFARKQHLEPKPIDLNERLPEIGALLKRTLGEHISLNLLPGADLWSALVDPGQVDDALVNLAINARDAMPDGGDIVIETANAILDEIYAAAHSEVSPGDFVLLSVSDTGSGMTPETVARAFEPFYTTKDVGKGTGLGLSQVYGWVKQSGGHIKIYSEIGHGTTIKLYLPRAISGLESDSDLTASLEETPTGTETILVVEDNPDLRRVVLHQLHDLGYSTLEADDAHAALRLVESGIAFDLIFTDVVMPGGMTGYELAKTVTASRPQMKIILTSGYTELAAQIGNGDFGKYQVLSKPYRKQDLARALRNALGEGRS